ncbi:MAG: hypothetical protein RIS70_2871 [Planctomycetota bacterium]|jgi:hypothetical protein
MHRIGKIAALLTAFSLTFSAASTKADALARLKPAKLEATHQAVQRLRQEVRPRPRDGEYREHRANLHVHSHWSHDSRGRLDEIVHAAKAVGTSVLMFTEHPADHYDFFEQGHRGVRDGVLLIPGAETQGFLAFPTLSLRGQNWGNPQEFSDLVRGRSGQMFVSHPEERMDWSIRGVTGMEIYNTHADFKDEKAMLNSLRNPLWLLQVADTIRQYPQEAYSALQDYPADYLKRWDELCLESPHTGVSANDAHQNVGLAIRWLSDNQARLEDALEKPLLELDLNAIPNQAMLREGKKPGDLVFRFQLDPYEHSLRHVGTHLLLREFSEAGVREALDEGRAFVAFDWLADATGFDMQIVNGNQRLVMGKQNPWRSGMELHAHAPLAGHWRVVRNGQLIHESQGSSLTLTLTEPGVYRCEVWLDVAGDRMPWILSNPIYLQK